MPKRVTTNDLAVMVNNAFQRLEDRLDERFDRVEDRVDRLDGRVDRLESGQEESRQEMSKMHYKLDVALNTTDKLEPRVARVEKHLALPPIQPRM